MSDEPKDAPRRGIADEIRDSVEEEIRDKVRRRQERRYRRDQFRSGFRRSGPPGIFLGLIILSLGVIFLLDQMGIVPAHESFRFFWGFVLTAWGVDILVTSRHDHSWFWGVLLTLFGVASMAQGMLGLIHISIGSLWPIILIVLGLLVLAQRMGYIPPGGPFRGPYCGPPDVEDQPGGPAAPDSPGPPGSATSPNPSNPPATPGTAGTSGIPGGTVPPSWQPPSPTPTPTPGGSVPPNWQPPHWQRPSWAPDPTAQRFTGSYNRNNRYGSSSDEAKFRQVAIFSGFKRRITSQQFKYANVSAVLGGFELDLTRAEMDGDQAVIEVACVLGGGEIRIPDTWKVVIETDTIGGGYSDETYLRPADPTKPPKRLIVRGTLAFGGIVIKN
jgi:Cell wall-active antibiotics response 4TMS YvqF